MTKFETILRLAIIQGRMVESVPEDIIDEIRELINDLSEEFQEEHEEDCKEYEDKLCDSDCEHRKLIGCCDCSPCATQGHFTVTLGRDSKEVMCLRCGVRCG